MITYKIYKKHLPKYISKQLPELFYDSSDSFIFDNNTIVVVMWDVGGICGPDLMGAVALEYKDFIIQDMSPMFDLYIARFEVNKDCLRKGYGKRMYEFIERNVKSIYKISLIHRAYDKNVSYKFWRAMGFKHVRGSSQYMEKKLI